MHPYPELLIPLGLCLPLKPLLSYFTSYFFKVKVSSYFPLHVKRLSSVLSCSELSSISIIVNFAFSLTH